ncbi:MAG: hypothetical protein M1830_003897 [Pleopsidium flavum]|nr:MAG: hypothetical protein M1830_003897 [Pleopsidium flavum]
MSSYRPAEERTASGDTYRPLPSQTRGDRDGRMYDDQHSRSNSKDRYQRNSPPSRRRTPPHDRSRTPPRGPAVEAKNGSMREWDLRRERDSARERKDHRRGQSPRGGYRDRDQEGYRSPGYDSRSRSRSPRRDRSPYYGGPPSREVILEGLPVEMAEDDVGHHYPFHQSFARPPYGRLSAVALDLQISKELKQYHDVEGLEDVRVIRDRHTKVSRQFGFLRFATLQNSRAFVERNYPMIYLYGSTSAEDDGEAAKVRIAFSRERDDRDRSERAEGEWTCKICTLVNFPGRMKCFRCQTPKIGVSAPGILAQPKPSHFTNSGDSDASSDATPSQFLLLRGLEPTVTEDLLAKGVAKLYKPSGGSTPPATSTNKKSGAKVASTTGDANLGAKDGSIRRVLLVRDRRSNESWRYGFAEFGTVEDAQAALTRFNSFEKFTISSKPVMVSYVHAGIFVPVFSPVPGTERFTFSPLGNTATKLAYWDDEAYVNELMLSTAEQEKGTTASETGTSAANKAAAAAEKEGLVTAGKESEAKVKKRKAEASAAASKKKSAPAHLQFWSNRHAELHGVRPQQPDDASTGDAAASEKRKSKSKALEQAEPPSQSFADLEKKCCYLCSRQFKTEAEVNKHERLSQLHRDNLKNEDLVVKASDKMAKASGPAEGTSEYRDRAKERRLAFGPPKKANTASKSEPIQPTPAEIDAPPAPSKGAFLLGKMGWSAGEGLGVQGTGMVAPVATDMYVQGVGLGAQGGKVGDAVDEASRNTKGGYSEFLERTKDKAKERFERMG